MRTAEEVEVEEGGRMGDVEEAGMEEERIGTLLEDLERAARSGVLRDGRWFGELAERKMEDLLFLE